MGSMLIRREEEDNNCVGPIDCENGLLKRDSLGLGHSETLVGFNSRPRSPQVYVSRQFQSSKTSVIKISITEKYERGMTQSWNRHTAFKKH